MMNWTISTINNTHNPGVARSREITFYNEAILFRSPFIPSAALCIVFGHIITYQIWWDAWN